MLALVTPDLRGLHMVGEQFNFFSQHVMLFLLPAVWIAKRRYTMYKGVRLTTLMWAVALLGHFDLLLPVSMTLVGNVNYMLTPPSVYPSHIVPHLYRPIISAVCYLLTVFSRHVLAEGLIVVTGVRRQVERERAEAAADAAPPSGSSRKPTVTVPPVSGTASDGAVGLPLSATADSPPASRSGGARRRTGTGRAA